MKASIKMISLVIALTTSSYLLPQKASAQVVSYQVFYDQLGPYGQWVTNPDYGYVWIPNAGSDFFPYGSNGYWINTDMGWSWYSNYTWGWAPFHYGRWDFDPSYGWFWIPGTEWGPAWVTWRNYQGYYGWQPMGIRSAYDDYNHCRFVRSSYFGRHDMNRYYVTNNVTIYRNSTRFNGNGPNVNDVRRLTGRTLNPVKIGTRDKPGQVMNGGRWDIYRPGIEKNSDAKPNPANYGGTQPGVNGQPGVKTTTPNPSNYGGMPGGPNPNRTQPPKSSPNPGNYGGVKPGPTRTVPGNTNQPVDRTVPTPSPQPGNYGGVKPGPTRTAPENTNPPVDRTVPSPSPRPGNYGGVKPGPTRTAPAPAPVKRAPAPQPQHSAPNPANYGGEKPGPKR